MNERMNESEHLSLNGTSVTLAVLWTVCMSCPAVEAEEEFCSIPAQLETAWKQQSPIQQCQGTEVV